MRDLSTTMKKKLASHVQAGDSALSANVWVSRPNTQLVDDIFLEKQKIPFGTSVTKASVAACHPRLMRDATDVYVGYVDGGTAKVAKAVYNYRMANHEWVDTGFAEPAEDISLCFDGTMPKNVKGASEFVSDKEPWVFWTSDGALYARKLTSTATVLLAEANCVAVSSVRAMWSEVNRFDFGLIAFFILNGYLYYKQLINNEWMDAELVSAVPAGVLWSDVSAFRTWDYRVGVQLVAQDGSIYELYTQFMGIGTRSTEHFEMKDASVSGELTQIEYHSLQHKGEHLWITNAQNVAPYQGNYEIGVPSLVDVYNVDDGNGDWGKRVVFVFDKELENNSVQSSMLSGCFYFTDTWGVSYYPSSIEMDRTGRIALLTFVNFNNAYQACTAHYVPGTVVTMVDEVLSEQSFVFVPQNLIPSDVPLPEVESIWNINSIGTEVAVKFTEPLIVVPNESASKFIVTVPELDYVPEGPLNNNVKPVKSVRGYSGVEQLVELDRGTHNGLSYISGKLSLEVVANE